MGAAQRWWLHHSLTSLAKDLKALGSRLILRRGKAVETLRALMEETGATTVHAIRHYEPWWRAAEEELGDRLCLHDGNHLARPNWSPPAAASRSASTRRSGRACRSICRPAHPLDPPSSLDAPGHWPKSEKLADWALLPTKPDWSTGFAEDWTPGERRRANAWRISAQGGRL